MAMYPAESEALCNGRVTGGRDIEQPKQIGIGTAIKNLIDAASANRTLSSELRAAFGLVDPEVNRAQGGAPVPAEPRMIDALNHAVHLIRQSNADMGRTLQHINS